MSQRLTANASFLDGFNNLVEFRRRRIEATSYVVPGALWGVVLIGAAVSIFGSYLFKIQSLSVHGLLTILLTTMIALLVFFIATTDHSYTGSNAIEPLAYEIVLRSHIRSIDTTARPFRYAGAAVRTDVAQLVRAKLKAFITI